MIAVIDYGLGNIRAFLNLYRRLNIPARAATSARDLQDVAKIILPGVGHFDHAMAQLDASGILGALEECVLVRRVPLLGVCVGMQILGCSSEEGDRHGLGWVDAHVRSFKRWEPTRTLPMPHMGWNDVRPSSTDRLFKHLEADGRFYFLHSFFLECHRSEEAVAFAQYGADFACAIRRDNIYGVQFHPEKSHHCGAQLLRNFAEL